MSRTHAANRGFTSPYLSLICVLAVLFVLPQYGSIAVMVGSVSILSAYVAILPESFRSRSGSLLIASGLVAVMWAMAAAITLLTLQEELQR